MAATSSASALLIFSGSGAGTAKAATSSASALLIFSGSRAGTANSAGMKFLVVDAAGNRRREDVYGGFRLNEWTHVAVVTGPGGETVWSFNTAGMYRAMIDSSGARRIAIYSDE